MKKILFLFGLLLAVILCVSVALFPRWLKPQIEGAVSGLKIEALSLGLFPIGLSFHGVHLKNGDPRDSAVFMEADSLFVPIGLNNLFRQRWLIGTIVARGVRVTVHEGDAHFPKFEKKSAPLPPFLCDGIRVDDAAFIYRKDSPAGSAFIRLPEVSAEALAFGNYGEWREQPAEAGARAVLEQSGKVMLRVKAWLYEQGPHAEVDLRIDDQILSQVNGYFEPEEGVTLKGRLLSSRALVKVKANQATGDLEAKYAGLEIDFHKNRHRGGFEALLLNLGAEVKLDKKNTEETRRERLGAVVTQRHARESVVSFILRTMREAALQVATK